MCVNKLPTSLQVFMSRRGLGKKMRKYGGHPEISYRKLSEASGVSANTIMQYVRILEEMEEDE